MAIHRLVEVINRKLNNTTLAAENIAVKAINMIDTIIEKVNPFLEENHLGDTIEKALIPLFSKLKDKRPHDLDNEIIEVLTNLITRRKSKLTLIQKSQA